MRCWSAPSRCERRRALPPGVDLTFQHVLLHLNLIELVGADDDAVASKVDTAAGLRRLDLLRETRGWGSGWRGSRSLVLKSLHPEALMPWH